MIRKKAFLILFLQIGGSDEQQTNGKKYVSVDDGILCDHNFDQRTGLDPAYLMSYIIDHVLGNGNITGLIGWIVLYVGVPLVCGLLSIFYAYFTAVKCRERMQEWAVKQRRLLQKRASFSRM